MSSRDFDPSCLDVAAFAKAAGATDGDWPLQRFDRLAESILAKASPASSVHVRWSARGELRVLRGEENQVWLHVEASTALPLECQRCLDAVDVPVQIDRRFLFVHGEDTAAQLDTDSEDDVLALTRALDLRALIEDELLLALPIVPRHLVCPVPLQAPMVDAEVANEEPHPFAALASLRRSGPVN